ncbi:putative reverse transcriptase domain-containing protein [Tanacetum coccineum]
MTISVISVSSDLFEDSVGTPARRVILFGTIPTTIPDTTPVITPPTTQTETIVIPTETPIIAPTIPPSRDYTPASPDYSPASDSESDPSEDPSSDHIPPLPATSPFLSSDNDTTDSDTPDTPPSLAYDTPFTEITSSTQRSPVIPRRRVMILAPGHPISHGRPYRYHLNGPVHMMTMRKRVGPLPTHRLAVRHFVDHSSSDLPSTSAGPSRKRRRSPMTFVPALPPVIEALSLVRADLIQSPKRIRSPDIATDLEGCSEDSLSHTSRGTDIEVDDDVERSDRMDIDPVEAVIKACFDFADIIRASGVDVRVETVTVTRDNVETGTRDPIVVSDDGDTPPVVLKVIPELAREGAAGSTYETLGDLGHRIVGVESTVTALTERVAELERDNRRLRGTASVESQRVDRLQRGMSRMQRELRQIRRKMPNTRSGASMTHEEVEELVTRRVAEEMEAREAAMNLEPLNENGDEQEGGNGGNGGNGNGGNGGNRNGGNGGNGNGGNGGNGNGGNGGNGNGENGNGNRNGNHGMNYGGFMLVARECTFQDFLKCKLHNFSGTEGVVGLTRWFEKMETVFNISNCPPKYQVGLIRLMTEVYYPRNEIQKMETELWNLTVKGNDLTAYTQRFQELILLCTRMVLDERDIVERFIGRLPDNIQGNVIAANPTRLQDTIRIANQLMDKNHLLDKLSFKST